MWDRGRWGGGGVEESEVSRQSLIKRRRRWIKLRWICSKDPEHLDPPVMFPSQPESGSVTTATFLNAAAADLHEDLVGGQEKWQQVAEAERPCSGHVA